MPWLAYTWCARLCTLIAVPTVTIFRAKRVQCRQGSQSFSALADRSLFPATQGHTARPTLGPRPNSGVLIDGCLTLLHALLACCEAMAAAIYHLFFTWLGV